MRPGWLITLLNGEPVSMNSSENPLLAEWTASFGAPPLERIKPEHFPPAFEQALEAHRGEIAAIAGESVLADEQSYVLPLGADDLAGLPDFARAAARAAAEQRGLAGHAVTLSRSSVEPFLQFSARRDLREKAFKAWIARGDNSGKND